MLPIAILQNDDSVPPGLLGENLLKRQVPADLVEVFAGDPLPDLAGVGGVVILGGHMGAYEEEDHPFISSEKELVRLAVARNVPLLGICLGCQIIADALGGRAYRVEPQEAGLVDLDVTHAGHHDPVGRALEGPMVSWHHDSWDLPPGATLLAATDQYPQAFRIGSAVGVQFHPEVTAEILGGWLERDGESLAEVDLNPIEFLTVVRSAEGSLQRRADGLFDAWTAETRVSA